MGKIIKSHFQSQRVFANVGLNFSNSNNRWMMFPHVVILFSFMQMVEEYLVALKDFDFSVS